jgi:hypothetical protein
VFLKEIVKRDAVPLAIKPMTLKLLLAEFKEEAGLPDTQHALYEKSCRRLCEEPSLDRRASGKEGELLPEERLTLAERIAAVTLFSKRSSIYLDRDTTRAPADCTTIAELSQGSESIRGAQRSVEPNHIRETLETGLFTGGTSERLVTWSHWTFTEFLSARYTGAARLLHGTDEANLDASDRTERFVSFRHSRKWPRGLRALSRVSWRSSSRSTPRSCSAALRRLVTTDSEPGSLSPC